jgi:hypothetical protein
MTVSEDLRPIIGKRELRYSLKERHFVMLNENLNAYRPKSRDYSLNSEAKERNKRIKRELTVWHWTSLR